jgi:hypothetical protein
MAKNKRPETPAEREERGLRPPGPKLQRAKRPKRGKGMKGPGEVTGPVSHSLANLAHITGAHIPGYRELRIVWVGTGNRHVRRKFHYTCESLGIVQQPLQRVGPFNSQAFKAALAALESAGALNRAETEGIANQFLGMVPQMSMPKLENSPNALHEKSQLTAFLVSGFPGAIVQLMGAESSNGKTLVYSWQFVLNTSAGEGRTTLAPKPAPGEAERITSELHYAETTGLPVYPALTEGRTEQKQTSAEEQARKEEWRLRSMPRREEQRETCPTFGPLPTGSEQVFTTEPSRTWENVHYERTLMRYAEGNGPAPLPFEWRCFRATVGRS